MLKRLAGLALEDDKQRLMDDNTCDADFGNY